MSLVNTVCTVSNSSVGAYMTECSGGHKEKYCLVCSISYIRFFGETEVAQYVLFDTRAEIIVRLATDHRGKEKEFVGSGVLEVLRRCYSLLSLQS